MKPRWGTKALTGPQGSASKLGATLGFGLQPLWGLEFQVVLQGQAAAGLVLAGAMDAVVFVEEIL